MNFDDKMRLRQCQTKVIMLAFVVLVVSLSDVIFKHDVVSLSFGAVVFSVLALIYAEVDMVIKSLEGTELRKRTLTEKIFSLGSILFYFFVLYQFFLSFKGYYK